LGTGQIEAAVADAGPIIHLAEIGCLAFLRLFKQLHVPQMVWAETVGLGRVVENSLVELNNVERQYPTPAEVIQFVETNGLENLHAGERESLYVCQQIGVSLVLTDDLAVREAAKKLKLAPVGSLGIIVRAYRAGLVSLEEAEKHIFDLQNISSLFVTHAIVKLALDELHRHVNKN
jgi:predicted nucleic acid-binding protein